MKALPEVRCKIIAAWSLLRKVLGTSRFRCGTEVGWWEALVRTGKGELEVPSLFFWLPLSINRYIREALAYSQQFAHVPTGIFWGLPYGVGTTYLRVTFELLPIQRCKEGLVRRTLSSCAVVPAR